MAAAALVAAQQFVDGSQEQEAKRPRVFAPGSAPSAAGSQDGVLLTQLLRAHLVQTNAVLDATNSTQLVLFKTPGVFPIQYKTNPTKNKTETPQEDTQRTR